MYQALWSFIVCVVVTVRGEPGDQAQCRDSELAGLVYGLNRNSIGGRRASVPEAAFLGGVVVVVFFVSEYHFLVGEMSSAA